MASESDILLDLMLLSRAAHIVLQEDVLGSVRKAGLTPAKTSVLRLLGRRGRQSVNDLARFLGQTKASASQNVDWLVRAGLARRSPDTKDRRCVWVSLTRRGHGVLERVEERQRQLLDQALKTLPRTAVQRLARDMRQLAFALLDESNPDPANCLQCCAYNSAGCVKHHGDWRCLYVEHQAAVARRGKTRAAAPDAPAEAPGHSARSRSK